jgi:hypothetical protein
MRLSRENDHPRPSDATLRVVAGRAATIGEVTRAMGLSPNGPANEAVRQELARLGLPDPTWRGGRPVPARVYPPRRNRCTGPYVPSPGQPSAHRAAWTEQDTDRLRTAMSAATSSRQGFGEIVAGLAVELTRTPDAVLAKVRALRLSPGRLTVCRCCGADLPPPTSLGRTRTFCGEPCRDRHRRAESARRRAGQMAAAQGPCEFCGTTIELRRRPVRFCSKSCAKKQAYQQSR